MVERDIHSAYLATGQNPENLPKLPSHVGGKTDLMIGIKYLKYFPKAVYELPSGLTIYECVFANPDGSRGVIGGPLRWKSSNDNVKDEPNSDGNRQMTT